MAKQYVTHACGHAVEYNLFGPYAERESRIEWLETVPCWDCRRQAGIEAAVAANTHLPALIGSEKQIAWAEQIRAKAIASADNRIETAPPSRERIEQMAASFGLPETEVEQRLHDVVAETTAAQQRLASETSAKWWIDNRGDVESLVERTLSQAVATAFADVRAKAQAEQAERNAAARAAAEREAAERLARRKEEDAKRLAAEAVVLEQAGTFVVADVQVDIDNLLVTAADGRTALGFIDGTEWAIYQIGEDGAASSLAPEMERIAADAKALWGSRQ